MSSCAACDKPIQGVSQLTGAQCGVSTMKFIIFGSTFRCSGPGTVLNRDKLAFPMTVWSGPHKRVRSVLASWKNLPDPR